MNIDIFSKLEEIIAKQKRAVREIISLSNVIAVTKNPQEKKMLSAHTESLKGFLKQISNSAILILEKISVTQPLHLVNSPVKKIVEKPIKRKVSMMTRIKNGKEMGEIEKTTLKRIRKGEKRIIQKREKKPSLYVKMANKLFSKNSISLLNKRYFRNLKRDLVKANLQFLSKSYVSVIFFTTLLSIIVGIFGMLFFLVFNIGPDLPIITFANEEITTRILKVFWIPIFVPLVTFFAMYVYPSLEKKSLEGKINQELPFATIHMSSISGSMIDPSKIFSIIIATREYPNLQKQFVKLMNEMNVFGYDFVTALRNIAFNSPSKKLTELLNGLATTITSGGNLPEFFDKRAQIFILVL